MQRLRRAEMGSVVRREWVAFAMVTVFLVICVGEAAGLEEPLPREKVPMDRGDAQGAPTGKVRRSSARSHPNLTSLRTHQLAPRISLALRVRPVGY